MSDHEDLDQLVLATKAHMIIGASRMAHNIKRLIEEGELDHDVPPYKIRHLIERAAIDAFPDDMDSDTIIDIAMASD